MMFAVSASFPRLGSPFDLDLINQTTAITNKESGVFMSTGYVGQHEPDNPATNLDERHMDKAASSTGIQVRAAAPLIGSDILAVVFRRRM